jgi:hypothetical protein
MIKKNKKVFFLAGLPRSGSTVLSSILNQHPQIYSTSTSGLIDVMGAVCSSWESSPSTAAQGSKKKEVYSMLRSIIEAKYEDVSKDIIIDKNRGWVNPVIMQTMNEVLGYRPKIIATVRSTADCASSFIRVAKPDDISNFLRNSSLIKHLKSSYAELKNGYETFPKDILFIEYDDFLQNPKHYMKLINSFISVDDFEYDFNNIDTKVVAEKDDIAWGVPGLHKISSKLGKQHNDDSKKYLGHEFDNFDQPRFWKGENKEYKKKKIDLSVDLAMKGLFEESYKIICEAQQENAFCNKIAFNMGWYALQKNKLQEGMDGLARGRYENCFGNPRPPVPTPMWDGKTMGTLLYYLEGGLGDQIHALKYIKDINKRGCDVIIACSAELFPIVKCCVGVKMIIEHAAAGGVYHDFWFPAMSILIPLGYEYNDIKGDPYIPKTNKSNNKKPVIGVRWQGNPKFEHEQNRRFPLKPFFDALKNIDADFVCLQRDEGEEDCPDFIKKVALNNWDQTRDVISGCDLVISSCTSVAHLSGAMGVPTWIILPVLHYYLWSVPGEKTPYYNSVRLFRQKKFGCWKDPIRKIGHALEEKYGVVNKRSRWKKIYDKIIG